MSIVIALIIIAVLIFFHELGHFIAARRVGIPVYEFSLGFGYRIWGTKRGETEYSVRLIPLGGYVRMAGEEPGDMEDPEGYNTRTPLEKMRVSFAGPFMNFVLAVVIYIITFTVIGVPTNNTIIGEVLKDKPAYQAGLKTGDKILAVNDQKVSDWNEFVENIQVQQAGTPVQLTIQRGQETREIKLTPIKNESTGKSIIGVTNTSKVTFEHRGVLTAIKTGFVQTYHMTVFMLEGLGMMFTGGVSASDIAGPVGITSMVGQAARDGMVYLLSFTAFLSINLGILNLLPIPALDGSRIVFAMVEAIRRKPMNPEKEGYIHFIGFIFLMLIIVFATYNDIVRLIKG